MSQTGGHGDVRLRRNFISIGPTGRASVLVEVGSRLQTHFLEELSALASEFTISRPTPKRK